MEERTFGVLVGEEGCPWEDGSQRGLLGNSCPELQEPCVLKNQVQRMEPLVVEEESFSNKSRLKMSCFLYLLPSAFSSVSGCTLGISRRSV